MGVVVQELAEFTFDNFGGVARDAKEFLEGFLLHVIQSCLTSIGRTCFVVIWEFRHLLSLTVKCDKVNGSLIFFSSAVHS